MSRTLDLAVHRAADTIDALAAGLNRKERAEFFARVREQLAMLEHAQPACDDSSPGDLLDGSSAT